MAAWFYAQFSDIMSPHEFAPWTYYISFINCSHSHKILQWS